MVQTPGGCDGGGGWCRQLLDYLSLHSGERLESVEHLDWLYDTLLIESIHNKVPISAYLLISTNLLILHIYIYLSIPDVAGLDPLRVPRGRVLAAAVPGVHPRHGHAHHGQVYLLYTRVYIISKHTYLYITTHEMIDVDIHNYTHISFF